MIYKAIQNKINPYLEHLNLQKRELEKRLKFHRKHKERGQVFKVESQLEAVQSKIKEYRKARKILQDQTA